MLQPAPEIRSFEVRVGHNRVTVESVSAESAIQAAREKLRLQLPRLWDVIDALEPHRFEVVLIS